jgi:hypothetical protein
LDTTKFYKIKELGNTMFTAFGAGTNIVGVSFKPTQTAWPTAANGNPTSGKLTIGAGGASGGTTGFSSAHTHSHTSSGGSHTLSVGQMPNHTHDIAMVTGYTGNIIGPGHRGNGTATVQLISSSAGGNQSGVTQSHSHTVTVDSATISAYKYIDVIVCSKD